jgi:Mg-chelatase subunit ChlD
MRLRRRYTGHGLTTYPPGRYFEQVSDLYAGKLFMVIDVSGSMTGRRLQQAVEGARRLLARAVAESYLVGVISFTSTARLELDLTTDLGAVDRVLSRLRPLGGTDMSWGIRCGHEILGPRRGERVLAIFSDGETDRETALAAARAARHDGIKIIATLGGTADPGFMREVTGDEEEFEVVGDAQIREHIAGLAGRLRPTWSRRGEYSP